MGGFAIPIIAAIVGAAGSAYQASEARKAQSDAADEARAYADKVAAENAAAWKANAFPTAEKTQSMQAESAANLGAERNKRYDTLARALSVRGIGPNSGVGAEGASNIEGDYLSALGASNAKITQFANTPQFNYPFASGSYQTMQPYQQTGANPLATAAGMMMYQSMNKNNASVPGQTINHDWEQNNNWDW